MSLFKEKDDIIVSAFRKFDSDSDEELESPEDSRKFNSTEVNEISIDDDEHVKKKIALDISGDQLESIGQEKNGQETPSIVCIDIDDGSGDEYNLPETRSRSSRRSRKRAKPKTRSKAKASRISRKKPPTEVISISSDEEQQPTSTSYLESYPEIETDSNQKLADLSQDPEDRNFALKLTLCGTFKQFRATYKTRLSDILKDLIEELRSQGKELIVTYEYRAVELTESPHSLNLSSGDKLDAIEVPYKSVASKPVNNPDEITVKVQDGNRKHTKEFRILKNKPIVDLKQQYRKEFNLSDNETIKLMFDGDILDDESTPEELEIEDDCIIDAMVH